MHIRVDISQTQAIPNTGWGEADLDELHKKWLPFFLLLFLIFPILGQRALSTRHQLLVLLLRLRHELHQTLEYVLSRHGMRNLTFLLLLRHRYFISLVDKANTTGTFSFSAWLSSFSTVSSINGLQLKHVPLYSRASKSCIATASFCRFSILHFITRDIFLFFGFFVLILPRFATTPATCNGESWVEMASSLRGFGGGAAAAASAVLVVVEDLSVAVRRLGHCEFVPDV
ncbi:hypothetical protein E2C01_036418 [Portunus trituberculatus]|uniref:Uncharacterized protein n=1 Tax=Portunus trituberculatus TaxID=210409 RepID=A0A5B7FB44_PORTR|nr:hypothetical protein [Portunus trituberculatus]